MKVVFVPFKKALYALGIILLLTVSWVAYSHYSYRNIAEELKLVILGYNDLGMHCTQPDYSQFFILPPGNNLTVQIFTKDVNPRLVTEGIKVRYKINCQNDPTKYSNFWSYANKYGYSLSPGVGITGNTLEGFMELDASKKFWKALAVPVTSLKSGIGDASPYQTATISVLDEKTGTLLQEFNNLVVPVSPEMDCLTCHKEWPDILKVHDKAEGTLLYKDSLVGKLHRCNECHADPILDAPGKQGVPSLSLAMHGLHANKMPSNSSVPCYFCHPGFETKCYRGVMSANNIDCIDCHGTMKEVAQSINNGRIPWLQEPGCEKCHGEEYGVNPSSLYRNSYLINSAFSAMNNIILCASCHNSPHAEWPSLLQLDNVLPLTYQGVASYIQKCSVCHSNNLTGKIHK